MRSAMALPSSAPLILSRNDFLPRTLMFMVHFIQNDFDAHPPSIFIPRISLLKISKSVGRASKGPRVELQRQGHASLRPFHGRLSELRCPQYVSIALTPPKASAPNLEARLPQCGRAFFIARHLNSGRENPINRSPADADLCGDLCRSHASVTKSAHLVSLGSGSWRSAHEREADHPLARALL